MARETRDGRFHMRLSTAEKAKLETAADAEGVATSVIVRRATMRECDRIIADAYRVKEEVAAGVVS